MSRLTISIICIILTFLAGIFLLYPKYQDLTFLSDQIKRKEAELRSQEGYFLNLISLSEELDKHEEQLILVDSAIPSTLSLPAIFDFLQKTASKNGLILKAMDHATHPFSETLKETKISLEMSGSYSSFKDFLSDLEKSARLIGVESISFSASEEEITAFSFLVTLRTYSY